MRLLRLLLTGLLLAASPFASAQGLRFALVKTSHAETLDAFTMEGGQWTRTVAVNHTAVLIQHHAATLLLDTGLGRQVDAQFQGDMPWWDKPLFKYEDVVPRASNWTATASASTASSSPTRTGTTPRAWRTFPRCRSGRPGRRSSSATSAPPAVLPSQFTHEILWRPFDFQPEPYMGFDESLDLFGDGSLVLVPLTGHTPGSVGLFLTLDDGRRFFFTGDTSWRLEGFTGPHEKFWVSRRMVDNDRDGTLAQLRRVHDLLQAEPELTVVPAHDAAVQDRLGYYPQWVQ